MVVIEAVYYRLQRGAQTMDSIIASFREVFAPVTTSVMTTIAAFLPLVLLPGILGDFMKVIPLVVTIALLISLFEAYWILPAHVLALKVNFRKPGYISRKREAISYWLRPALYPGAGQLPAPPGYYPDLHNTDPVPGGGHDSHRPYSLQFLRVRPRNGCFT